MVKYSINKFLPIFMENKDQPESASPPGKLIGYLSSVILDGEPDGFYDLFFTTAGIIVALIGVRSAGHVMQLDSWTKYPAGVPLGLGWSDHMAGELGAKGPEAILQANEANDIIMYSDIESILIHNGKLLSSSQFFVFLNNRTQLRFTFSRQWPNNSTEILKEMLPDKVSIV